MTGGESMVAEIQEIPNPQANYITVTNVRTRDGKQIVYIDREATRVMFPWHKISFVETLPSEDDHEEIETFFRD
jgi:hypothetical protein